MMAIGYVKTRNTSKLLPDEVDSRCISHRPRGVAVSVRCKEIHIRPLKGGTATAGEAPLLLDPSTMLIKDNG